MEDPIPIRNRDNDLDLPLPPPPVEGHGDADDDDPNNILQDPVVVKMYQGLEKKLWFALAQINLLTQWVHRETGVDLIDRNSDVYKEALLEEDIRVIQRISSDLAQQPKSNSSGRVTRSKSKSTKSSNQQLGSQSQPEGSPPSTNCDYMYDFSDLMEPEFDEGSGEAEEPVEVKFVIDPAAGEALRPKETQHELPGPQDDFDRPRRRKTSSTNYSYDTDHSDDSEHDQDEEFTEGVAKGRGRSHRLGRPKDPIWNQFSLAKGYGGRKIGLARCKSCSLGITPAIGSLKLHLQMCCKKYKPKGQTSQINSTRLNHHSAAGSETRCSRGIEESATKYHRNLPIQIQTSPGSNYDSDYEVGSVKRTLSGSVRKADSGRPRDPIWNEYVLSHDSSRKILAALCKICGHSVTPQAPRLKIHHNKCSGIEADRPPKTKKSSESRIPVTLDEDSNNGPHTTSQISVENRGRAPTGRKPHPLWKHFDIVRDSKGNMTSVICHLCRATVSPQITRMKIHMERCQMEKGQGQGDDPAGDEDEDEVIEDDDDVIQSGSEEGSESDPDFIVPDKVQKYSRPKRGQSLRRGQQGQLKSSAGRKKDPIWEKFELTRDPDAKVTLAKCKSCNSIVSHQAPRLRAHYVHCQRASGNEVDDEVAQLVGRAKARVEYGRARYPKMCQECGKIILGSLEAHLLIHADLRPHQCNRCGKTFRRDHHLKTHRLEVHEGIRVKRKNPRKRKSKSQHLQTTGTGSTSTPVSAMSLSQNIQPAMWNASRDSVGVDPAPGPINPDPQDNQQYMPLETSSSTSICPTATNNQENQTEFGVLSVGVSEPVYIIYDKQL